MVMNSMKEIQKNVYLLHTLYCIKINTLKMLSPTEYNFVLSLWLHLSIDVCWRTLYTITKFGILLLAAFLLHCLKRGKEGTCIFNELQYNVNVYLELNSLRCVEVEQMSARTAGLTALFTYSQTSRCKKYEQKRCPGLSSQGPRDNILMHLLTND